jgi:hypothetical protein
MCRSYADARRRRCAFFSPERRCQKRGDMPSTGVRCRCPRRSPATPPSQPLAALVVVAVPVGRGAAAPGAGALTTLKHFRFARRRSTLPQIVPTRERTGHGCSLGSVRPVLDLDVKGPAGGLVTWERAGELGRAAGDHAEVEPLRLTGASLFVRAPSAGARSWTASPSLTTSNTRCVPRAGSSCTGGSPGARWSAPRGAPSLVS